MITITNDKIFRNSQEIGELFFATTRKRYELFIQWPGMISIDNEGLKLIIAALDEKNKEI